MCMCDDKYFKVTNVTTGKVKLYKRVSSIASRFGVHKCCVFDYLRCGQLIHTNGFQYKIEKNEHTECRELRNKIKVHFNKRPSYLTEYQIRQYQEYFVRLELGY